MSDSSPRRRGRPRNPNTKRRRLVNFRVIEELYDQAQMLAYLDRVTVSEMVLRWLEAWVESRQRQLNRGRPFEVEKVYPPDHARRKGEADNAR